MRNKIKEQEQKIRTKNGKANLNLKIRTENKKQS